ncbi:hypothetical protein GGI20_002321 [Coemansia sp. BCRC 34301]|nr:hypothetical protein GGI20_002321 [Coemansia sp. BCRC 34301]
MSSPSFSPSNVDWATPNATQARLPKLSPEFIAQHYPASTKLLHVHLIHRHGERTPASHLFHDISPRYWNFCAEGNRLHADFAKAVQLHVPGVDKDVSNTQQWYNYMYKSENRKNYSVSPKDNRAAEHTNDSTQFTAATCAFGQLTDVGRQSLTALGAHMRALYVDALGFLPAVPRSGDGNGPTEDLYLRSTSYSRAFESLQHALGGMYPNLPANSTLFRINVRPISRENIIPDYWCKIMDRLHKESAVKSIEIFAKDYAALHKEVMLIPSLRELFEAEFKRRMEHAALYVWDTVSSARAHGLPLPKEIDDDFIARVSRMAAAGYLHASTQSAQLARMQIGTLVRELADNVVSAVEADRGVLASKCQPPKMSIYSGHDTTVGPLLALLGDAFDGSPLLKTAAGPMWPPFASSLRIELLKDSTSPHPTVKPTWASDLANHSDDLSAIPPEERIRPLNVPDSLYRWAPGQPGNATGVPFNPRATRDYYVRLWYNDRSVQLPACLDPGAHHTKLGPTVCTLDGFFKQIARYVPSDDEVIQERRALANAQEKQMS